MAAKYTEQWYRSLDGETFFSRRKRNVSGKTEKLAPSDDPEYKALPRYIQQEIWAGKYGLTWAQYIGIPAAERTNLNLSSQGIDIISVSADMGKAAENDARAATVRGALGGLKFGSKALFWFGVGFTLYFFREPINRTLTKAKAGAA